MRHTPIKSVCCITAAAAVLFGMAGCAKPKVLNTEPTDYSAGETATITVFDAGKDTAGDKFEETTAPSDTTAATGTSKGDFPKSGSINGFYIFPQPPSDSGAASDYNDFSYYFAIKDDEGISTYVIEGVCLDPEYDDEFRSVMDKCIHSISIDSEDKDSKDKDSEADDSEDNEDNKESDTEQ